MELTNTDRRTTHLARLPDGRPALDLAGACIDDDLLVDRVEDMIISRAERISPREIEGVLHGHPGVLEAAVVGRAHRFAGEEPVAFVALRSPGAVEPDELLELCAASLAGFKVPREIVILDTLPKDPSGRPAKPVLRDLVASISTAASSA
jgi:acyl-CoA synthetase (AMP-forming)/AMP-acid ligase II